MQLEGHVPERDRAISAPFKHGGPVGCALAAMIGTFAATTSAPAIDVVAGGHDLRLIADSVTPLHPSQVILGRNDGAAGPPTGIESITVDQRTGLIYVQVMDPIFACPSSTTAVFRIDPAAGGLTTVVNGNTLFGVCERGTDMDFDPVRGLLVVQNETPVIVGGEVATLSLPAGIPGTWVAPSVFASNSFGVDFSKRPGAVPAGELVYVADVGGGINSAAFGGPNVPRAMPSGGGDDLYMQPDGDIVFIGDFTVGIWSYDPFTFLATPAALPDVETMFTDAGLPFGCGTRSTACQFTGQGFVSWSCAPGGNGIFRLNEALDMSTLLVRMAEDEGIHDITIARPTDGSQDPSLYFTVENYTTGAHQVWELTRACKLLEPKWIQPPHESRQILYASTGSAGNSLITVDPFTGASTLVALFSGQFGPVSDIDLGPDGIIYGVTGQGVGDLLRIDPTSVPPDSLIGNNGLGGFANIALEWVGETLYTIVIPGPGLSSDLAILDPATGLATIVGPTGLGPLGALAYDPDAGTMYGSETGGPGANGNLVKIDLATGMATIIGPTGFQNVTALEFSQANGLLYGGLGSADPFLPGALIEIDPSTGNAVPIGPTGPALSGLTFAPGPGEGFNVASNIDLLTLFEAPDGTVVEPSVVTADDFRSNGKPITCVRWWGSYIDPAFEPNPDEPGDLMVDGWLLSFHSDLPADQNPNGPFSQPRELIGLYHCPADKVFIKPTGIVGWDGHQVYEYVVELRDCCLIHSYFDPITDDFPARPDAFYETNEIIYWLDIQAAVGLTFFDDGSGNCFPEPTNNRAFEDFWGWHTSPELWNDESVRGFVIMKNMELWLYVGWGVVDGSQHELEKVSQAFELLTPVPLCPCDFDGNDAVDVNDLLWLLGQWGTPWGDCTGDEQTDVNDLLALLGAWGPCP